MSRIRVSSGVNHDYKCHSTETPRHIQEAIGKLFAGEFETPRLSFGKPAGIAKVSRGLYRIFPQRCLLCQIDKIFVHPPKNPTLSTLSAIRSTLGCSKRLKKKEKKNANCKCFGNISSNPCAFEKRRTYRGQHREGGRKNNPPWDFHAMTNVVRVRDTNCSCILVPICIRRMRFPRHSLFT